MGKFFMICCGLYGCSMMNGLCIVLGRGVWCVFGGMLVFYLFF